MPFNHYAKIKRILKNETGWYIVKVNEPTSAKNFKGEVLHFPYYYRIYSNKDQPIPYCKFQQLDKLASILNIPEYELPFK